MIKLHDKGTLLFIQVKPRSRKQTISLENESICVVHVKAPPTRGQANAEVRKLIAKQLQIPTHRVRINAGNKSSKKTLLIEDMEPRQVLAALRK